MALIFDDLIQATDCSGLYTLMGYVNGTWQDIHTISGPSTGSIEVDASFNTIDVDTTLFIPGETYQFKWVDGNGVSSNLITLTIPAESGPAYYYSSGSGAGGGSLGNIDFLTWLYDGTIGESQITFDINVPAGGTLALVDTVTSQSWNFAGDDSWVINNYSTGLGGLEPQPGHQYVITCTDDSGNVTTSNIFTAIGCKILSMADSGDGRCEIAYNVGLAPYSGNLAIVDMTSGITIWGPEGLNGNENGDYVFDIPYTIGHEYRLEVADSNGNVAYSDPQTAQPDASSYSYYYYGDSSGAGSGNLSTINFLGLNADSGPGSYISATGFIAKSNIDAYLLDVTAATSTATEIVPGLGEFFAPSADIDFPFTVGHQYQLALVDLDANPSANLSDPSTIFSNTLTAANLVVNSVTNIGGFIGANITIDPSLGAGGGVANLPLADSTGIYGLAGVLLPFSPETQDIVTNQLYVSGNYIQIQTGSSASIFKQLP